MRCIEMNGEYGVIVLLDEINRNMRCIEIGFSENASIQLTD